MYSLISHTDADTLRVCRVYTMYPTEDEAKDLVAELCKLFYDQGWVSGTGGGISIRSRREGSGSTSLVMAPSGVQKERMRSADMFVLDMKGNVISTPGTRPPPYKPPKLSECSPLFMLVSSAVVAAGSQPVHAAAGCASDGTVCVMCPQICKNVALFV